MQFPQADSVNLNSKNPKSTELFSHSGLTVDQKYFQLINRGLVARAEPVGGETAPDMWSWGSCAGSLVISLESPLHYLPLNWAFKQLEI